MRILHIEPWSLPTQVFIEELHAGTGCMVEHAASIDEGLLKVMVAHGSIDVALYTVGPNVTDAFTFPDRARAATAEASIRCPQFVVLASSTLPLAWAVKSIDWQVVYLLREYPKQIVETVRAMLGKLRTSKPGPTVSVTRGVRTRYPMPKETPGDVTFVKPPASWKL